MGSEKTFELMLELGHKSSPITKKANNRSTHKWSVFVRGMSDKKIENCIDKVVFNLHQDFQNARREIHKPPYLVTETGYAGFHFPIEIYFKNKDTPNHIVYDYDLKLLKDVPCGNTRIERIKFINPNKEFERYLLKSGAEVVTSHKKESHSLDDSHKNDWPPAKKQKSSLIPSKEITGKQHSNSQDISHSNHSQLNQQATKDSKPNNSFIGVFGNPLVPKQTHQPSYTIPLIKKEKVKEPIPDTTKKSKKKSKGKDKVKSKHKDKSKDKVKSKHRDRDKDSGKAKESDASKPFSKDRERERNDNHREAERTRDRECELDKERERLGEKDLECDRERLEREKGKERRNVLDSKEQREREREFERKSGKEKSQVFANNTNHDFRFNLSMIYSKLNLADCDRLQKIVDIIEESGEWYKVTEKKFLFDLERLDKKTLHRIERCLNNKTDLI